MPDQPLHFTSERETVLASILESRLHLSRLESDMHETVLRSHEMISQSLGLIARANEALTRTASIFSAKAPAAWRYS
jgi:hypothetical protein